MCLNTYLSPQGINNWHFFLHALCGHMTQDLFVLSCGVSKQLSAYDCLGCMQRGRSGPSSSAAKLSIPKPVNLPSLRKVGSCLDGGLSCKALHTYSAFL